MAIAKLLKDLGFESDPDGKAAAQLNADAQRMSDNGRYQVKDVYVRGELMLLIEQNQAEDDTGGVTATIHHPPLAVLVSPDVRVAFNPDDLDLLTQLVGEFDARLKQGG